MIEILEDLIKCCSPHVEDTNTSSKSVGSSNQAANSSKDEDSRGNHSVEINVKPETNAATGSLKSAPESFVPVVGAIKKYYVCSNISELVCNAEWQDIKVENLQNVS